MAKYERNDYGIRFDNNTPSFELRHTGRSSLIIFIINHSGGTIKTRQGASRLLILIIIIAGLLVYAMLQKPNHESPNPSVPPPFQRT